MPVELGQVGLKSQKLLTSIPHKGWIRSPRQGYWPFWAEILVGDGVDRGLNNCKSRISNKSKDQKKFKGLSSLGKSSMFLRIKVHLQTVTQDVEKSCHFAIHCPILEFSTNIERADHMLENGVGLS